MFLTFQLFISIRITQIHTKNDPLGTRQWAYTLTAPAPNPKNNVQ